MQKNFFKRTEKVSARGKSNSNIPTYVFSAANSGNDDAYIEITENGGYVLYMLKKTVTLRKPSLTFPTRCASAQTALQKQMLFYERKLLRNKKQHRYHKLRVC
ncbi:MAG: hypothetical protein L6V93_09165 [Clostridiales bacterium]|nr:MAG: hypothetical protein L6V93_09165 [Clostridiales bacterium]